MCTGKLESPWDTSLEKSFRVVFLADSKQIRFARWAVRADRILEWRSVIQILESMEKPGGLGMLVDGLDQSLRNAVDRRIIPCLAPGNGEKTQHQRIIYAF